MGSGSMDSLFEGTPYSLQLVCLAIASSGDGLIVSERLGLFVTLYKAAGLVQFQVDGPGQAGGGGGGDSLSLSLQVRGDLNCTDGYAWRLVQHLRMVLVLDLTRWKVSP